MNNEEFEKLVDEGIKAIPAKFLAKLDNVAILVQDLPTKEQLGKTHTDTGYILLGLYEGIPQTNRWQYNQALPDKITIFKKNIEKIAHSKEEIKQTVKDTVWHEIAHHFGMNEDRVRQAEKRLRRKKQPR